MKKNTGKKFTAFFLSATMLFGGFNVQAVWDGSAADKALIEAPAGTLTKTLVDMSSINDIIEYSAVPSSKISGNGKYTACWANHKRNTSLKFEKVPYDWSDVEWIEIPVYSEKITNVTIGMIIYCGKSPEGKSAYYNYKMKIDWQGWKTFKLYLNKHLTALNNADLSKVQYMLLSAKDYGGEAHDETTLYFDSIIGHMKDYEKPERDAKALYEATEGALAVYNHSKNVYSNHTVSLMDENDINAVTTTMNGHTMLPVKFFEKYMGATVSAEGNSVKITVDDKYISFNINEVMFNANGADGTFVQAPTYWRDILFVPLADTVKALGKVSKQYGELNLIGSDENIEAFDKNEELPSICINKFVNVVIGLESFEKEDFYHILDNHRLTLVGDESNDLTNPNIVNTIKKAENQGKQSWEKMNYGKDRDEKFALFGDARVETTAHMSEQSTGLLRMAKAWGTYGSELYHNEKLLADLLDGIEWFYQNLYGEDEAKNQGWRDYTLYNWYEWGEDVPRALCNIYTILVDHISLEKRRQYFAMTYVAQKTWGTGKSMDDANSRLSRDTLMACLTEDMELLRSAIEDLGIIITPVDSGNGYQEDGLFIYHGKFPYTSGYGINTAISPVTFFQVLNGTKASFENQHKARFMKYMEETFYPILHNGRAQVMFGGRNITSVDDIYSGYQVIRASLYLLGVFGPDEDLWLKQMIRQNVDESNYDYILSMLSLNLVNKFIEVMNDDTIPLLPNDYHNCRVYYTGDRVVQQRPDYTVGISMSSQRVGNYESINVDNEWGWYIGDGALYVYNQGPKQFHLDYFKNVDWYKYPGTTEDTQERIPAHISMAETWVPKNYIAGGVQVDDDYAIIGMDFKALHNPVQSNATDKGHGGAVPPHSCSLNAKKAWFLLDDEVVALGANINATDGFPVNTYVTNRMLYENGNVPGVEDVVVNGEMLEKSASYTKTFEKAKWAYIEGDGGYIFPQQGKLVLNKTDKNPSFLEMWVDHGVSPKNKTYAYVVLPNRTQEETQKYFENPDIKILSNTNKIQAVRETKINLTGYIFWEAYTFDGITVDNPLVITTDENEGGYNVRISDASQTLQSAVVTIDKKLEFKEAPENVTVTQTNGKTVITLDLREARGETHVVKFVKK